VSACYWLYGQHPRDSSYMQPYLSRQPRSTGATSPYLYISKYSLEA